MHEAVAAHLPVRTADRKIHVIVYISKGPHVCLVSQQCWEDWSDLVSTLTSWGVPWLGRQKATRQGWSGGRLEAVASLMMIDGRRGGRHSVEGRLLAPAETCNNRT